VSVFVEIISSRYFRLVGREQGEMFELRLVEVSYDRPVGGAADVLRLLPSATPHLYIRGYIT
jgi:hypothetical protein